MKRSHAAAALGIAFVFVFVFSSGCTTVDDPEPAEAPDRRPLFAGTVTGACRWPQVVTIDDGCTGVLIHRELVLYAAHCGVAIREVGYNGTQVPVSACAAYPGAQPGGSDIAYCRLAAPLRGAPTALIAAPCEAAGITAGATAHIVGFGQSEEERFGTRREATAVIAAVGAEIDVRGDGAGTCFGDSGGPLFVFVPSGAGAALRVAGVLSSKDSGACPSGLLHYTKATPFVPWIEAETGLDLTPCTDARDAWDPSPDCQDGTISTCDLAPPRRSETCGAPAPDSPPPPTPITLTEPAAGEIIVAPPGERANVPFAISPRDARGIREIRVLVTDAAGELVWQQTTSAPPWSLRPGWFAPRQTYQVTLQVEAYSGALVRTTRDFQVIAGEATVPSCAVARDPRGPARPLGGLTLLAVVLLAWARRRRLSPRLLEQRLDQNEDDANDRAARNDAGAQGLLVLDEHAVGGRFGCSTAPAHHPEQETAQRHDQ